MTAAKEKIQSDLANLHQSHSTTDALTGRPLTNQSLVFDQNAWDNVEWDNQQLMNAEQRTQLHFNQSTLTHQQKLIYSNDANNYWNTFYENNTTQFFKDRNWLKSEFPDLFVEGGLCVLEVGCGVGNTVFPLLRDTIDAFVYCCDFSATAIDILKNQPSYDENRCKAFVYDITCSDDSVDAVNMPVADASIDVITLIFVFSALTPTKWKQALNNIYKLLKPDGIVLFRDYGRYDLCQLRMKSERCLDRNFYVRGDGTQVYFFTLEEIDEMFGGGQSGFEVVELVEDRRLLVNRAKKLKMYRRWIQGKFRKVKYS